MECSFSSMQPLTDEDTLLIFLIFKWTISRSVFVGIVLTFLIFKMNLLQECVRWDVHVNFWTRQGCKTLFSNSTHTTCEFDYISTYAVIKTLDEADDLKILPIVIISVTNCCVAGIIIMFAVLCWKRVKVGFSECSSWTSSVFSLCCFSLTHPPTPFHCQTDFCDTCSDAH